MNFREFYEAAKAVDPMDAIQCEVKAGRYIHDGGRGKYEVFEIVLSLYTMWSGGQH